MESGSSGRAEARGGGLWRGGEWLERACRGTEGGWILAREHIAITTVARIIGSRHFLLIHLRTVTRLYQPFNHIRTSAAGRARRPRPTPNELRVKFIFKNYLFQ